ncbi:MAG: acyltransferase family protein [Marinovum sp.]|nr:acyltransferase family protein [Marinovum sp.]
MNTLTVSRFHGLDFLRAMAMLLGLVFHAPMLYYIPIMADGFKEFGISSETMPEMEQWLSLLVQWLHSWRMSVFFTISGFFTALVLSRRTLRAFITDRFIKIGLTMILFAALYDFLDGQFDGELEHIWFLYYLMIFSILACGLSLAGLIASEETCQSSHNPGDQGSYFGSIKQLLLLAVVLVVIRPICDVLDGGAITVATDYFSIKIGGFLYFWIWFCAGLWLFKNQSLLTSGKGLFAVIALGIVSIIIFVFLSPYLTGVFGYNALKPDTLFDFMTLSLLKGVNTLAWMAFLILITHRLIVKTHKPITWFVTLSYPIYLFHLFPCMIVSAILIGLGLSQAGVVIGTVVAAFAISVALYYVLVKFTPLSWLILGYKKSWLQPFK